MVLSILILALSLSGLSIATDAAQSTTFSITNFSFSGSPDGPNALYSLSVSTRDSEPVLCRTTTPTGTTIGFFPSTNCSDQAWTFSWLAYEGSPDAGNVVNITHKGAAADGKDLSAQLTLSHDAVQSHTADGVSVEFLNQGYGTGYGSNFTLTASEVN